MLKRHSAKRDAQEIADALRGTKRQKGVQLRRAKQHKSSKYSLVQMLSILELAMREDSDIIYFDHVALHMRLAEFAMQSAEAVAKYEDGCGKRCCFDSAVGLAFKIRSAMGLAIQTRLYDENDNKLKARTGMVKAKILLNSLLEDMRKTINEIGSDTEIRRMRDAQKGFDLTDKTKDQDETGAQAACE
jgi:hypothetical protein